MKKILPEKTFYNQRKMDNWEMQMLAVDLEGWF